MSVDKRRLDAFLFAFGQRDESGSKDATVCRRLSRRWCVEDDDLVDASGITLCRRRTSMSFHAAADETPAADRRRWGCPARRLCPVDTLTSRSVSLILDSSKLTYKKCRKDREPKKCSRQNLTKEMSFYCDLAWCDQGVTALDQHSVEQIPPPSRWLCKKV